MTRSRPLQALVLPGDGNDSPARIGGEQRRDERRHLRRALAAEETQHGERILGQPQRGARNARQKRLAAVRVRVDDHSRSAAHGGAEARALRLLRGLVGRDQHAVYVSDQPEVGRKVGVVGERHRERHVRQRLAHGVAQHRVEVGQHRQHRGRLLHREEARDARAEGAPPQLDERLQHAQLRHQAERHAALHHAVVEVVAANPEDAAHRVERQHHVGEVVQRHLEPGMAAGGRRGDGARRRTVSAAGAEVEND